MGMDRVLVSRRSFEYHEVAFKAPILVPFSASSAKWVLPYELAKLFFCDITVSLVAP